ncbi:MAG: hypothetical protein NC517_10535 [Firmicutes bacterium]|nr:hypothetical protein [Bacillota bacterium]
MKKKKVCLLTVIVLAVLLGIYGLCTYISFRGRGLEQGLVGQVPEDAYPAWDSWNSSQKVSELERETVPFQSISD